MATQTQTTTGLGPDVAIQKTEEFDPDWARWIVDNKDISKDERDAVRRLFKNRVNGNKHITTYKLGRDVKSAENAGRFCAVKGEGLQCLSRDCRSALAQKYYWDIDIVNAQPTLLQQYAEKRGWVCDTLRRYNQTREHFIGELMDALGVDRGEAKQRITALCFGGSATGMTVFFAHELYPELRKLADNMWREHPKDQGWIGKKPNPLGSMMAYVLQTEERKCLIEMDYAFARQNRSLDVYIHDGGLVRKKEGEMRIPEEVLRRVEREVEEKTGYKVSLAVKELKTSLERDGGDDDDGAYAGLKSQWEETGFKGYTTFYLREQSCFVKVGSDAKDNILMKCKTDLYTDEEANLLPSGELFVKRWLADPTRREYYKVDFLPGRETPEHTYNLFRGFEKPPRAGDFSVFTELLWLISGKNQQVADYIEKWVACLFQRPWKKTGICIIVKGLKGVGKDTYFDGIGRIIGRKHFLTTAKPEHEVFGKFNAQLSQLLFLKFEEANFETNRDNEDQLKKLITSEEESIERKGHDPIRTTSCVNCVMTTNKHIPIPMSDDERRFMMVEASDEKRGDTAFWKRVQAAVRDDAVLSAYHAHLLSLDLSDFDPTQVVKTPYYHDVLQSFAPYHARYFQRLLEGEDGERVEPYVWTARNLFTAMKQMNSKFDLTEQKFGRDMRLYEGVCMTKRRMGWGSEYSFDPKGLEGLLRERGWWIEY